MQYSKPPRSRLYDPYVLLGALVIVAIFMGLISAYEDGRFEWRGLMGNLATELLGAAVTYLIIDGVISSRENAQQLKAQLIREMGNPERGIAARAVAELRSHGWLMDGSLNGWFISGANLEGVYLRDANLTGLGIFRSTLKDAKVTDEQLVHLNDLRLTIMPDGTMYNGRFCLKGDLDWALSKFGIDVQTATPAVMAEYYGVSIEDYLKGLEWAKVHVKERLPTPKPTL